MSDDEEETTTVTTADFHGEALDDAPENYRKLREQCPVGRSDLYGGFTYLSRYSDVHRAEQQAEIYSVRPSMLMPPVAERPIIVIDSDPPEHQGLRRALLPMFTPAEVKQWEPMIQEAADSLLAAIDPDEPFDASELFARPLPAVVFSHIAGFPRQDLDKFDDWVTKIFYIRREDPESAREAERATLDYFASLVKRRREMPVQTDLVGRLLETRVDGELLSDEAIVEYCYLLLLAGLDTTAWAIRSSLWHLAGSPEDREFLSEDLGRTDLAVEEFLRCLSPVQAMARTALTETTVGDVVIPKGQRVALLFGAANRDPEVFDRPDEVILDRNPNRHIAFGAGIHRCVGSNLGRLEMKIAINAFLKRFPDFELTPGQSWHGVGPLHLRVC